MKPIIHFGNETLREPSLSNVITKLVIAEFFNEGTSNGNITIANITDEIDEYDLDEEENALAKKYKDEGEFFAVTQCVVGAWEQPLGIIAVEYDYRTYADTQIFKENGKPCEEEWNIIKNYTPSPYKYNDDEANEMFAISFNDVNQQEDSDWGDTLVTLLNEWVDEHTKEGETPQYWYLGDEKEEYVFCY